jgi:hypothetical protein
VGLSRVQARPSDWVPQLQVPDFNSLGEAIVSRDQQAYHIDTTFEPRPSPYILTTSASTRPTRSLIATPTALGTRDDGIPFARVLFYF